MTRKIKLGIIASLTITGCVTVDTPPQVDYLNKYLSPDRHVVAIEERYLDGDVPQMVYRIERKSSSKDTKKKELDKEVNDADDKDPLLIIFQ